MAEKKKGCGLGLGAVIRFVEKLGGTLGNFPIFLYGSYRGWLIEDSGFVIFRKHRGCLLVELSPPDEYHTIFRPKEKNSLRPDHNSENCGFIDHEEDEWFSGRVSVFQIHGNVSSLLTNQYSFLGQAHGSMGAESYDVNPGYLLLLGGVATALSVVFEGCLLIAKFVDVPKAWWFSLLSLIPYFFYIPLNTQVSENQQVWIRFPALYEMAALLLIVAAAFVSFAACALACICASITCCGTCGIMSGYALLLLVMIALWTNFTFPASFDFYFDFDFSFSTYLEILKVLTWTAMLSDLIAFIAFLCSLRTDSKGGHELSDEAVCSTGYWRRCAVQACLAPKLASAKRKITGSRTAVQETTFLPFLKEHPLPSPTAVTTIAIQPTLAILNALPLGPPVLSRGVHFPSWFSLSSF
ncbi:unnamed protein product [Symbiodinium sp. CCMP2456]|nr:unnamed protein product [Symbiodinium sp. CCMP2456]